jgi:hypothetical protein
VSGSICISKVAHMQPMHSPSEAKPDAQALAENA